MAQLVPLLVLTEWPLSCPCITSPLAIKLMQKI